MHLITSHYHHISPLYKIVFLKKIVFQKSCTGFHRWSGCHYLQAFSMFQRVKQHPFGGAGFRNHITARFGLTPCGSRVRAEAAKLLKAAWASAEASRKLTSAYPANTAVEKPGKKENLRFDMIV